MRFEKLRDIHALDDAPALQKSLTIAGTGLLPLEPCAHKLDHHRLSVAHDHGIKEFGHRLGIAGAGAAGDYEWMGQVPFGRQPWNA